MVMTDQLLTKPHRAQCRTDQQLLLLMLAPALTLQSPTILAKALSRHSGPPANLGAARMKSAGASWSLGG